MKIAVVTTTINVPKLLVDYAKNFDKFGWKKSDVFFVIAGDKKTPSLVDFASLLYSDHGYRCEYLGLKEQEDLSPSLNRYIPLNTISRRNFAILKAYIEGADIVVTIDDDNLVRPTYDYLGAHAIIGTKKKIKHISANGGWYDVSKTLNETDKKAFYHRGYPIDQRMEFEISTNVREAEVIVSAGLWLEAPDTDAIAWINFGSLKVLSFDSTMHGEQFTLERGTWCPFNSQNTALARKTIPAYFLNPPQMRYDDIWASYIVRKIADHLGHSVSYGQPLVTQKRNQHNYMTDLKNEMDGMDRTPGLIRELRNMELTQKNYKDATYELVDRLSDRYKDLKTGYKNWLSVLEEIK